MILELSRAEVDKLVIGELRKRMRRKNPLPISVDYEPRTQGGFCHVHWIEGPNKNKPIPSKRAKPRRGPMRDPKYRRWLRNELCVVGMACGSETCSSFIRQFDAAHTQNNGMRSKGPDSSCAPLCRKHHAEYDAGRAAFENKYGVDMKAIAAEHYKRFQSEHLNAIQEGVEADFDPRDDYRK